MIEFICASHNEDVLWANLLRSPILEKYPLTVQKNYKNVSRAYNEVCTSAEIVVYLHHDVFLPKTFELDLMMALYRIPDFGVLGVAGVTEGRKIHGHIQDRGREWGSSEGLPALVDTLDEMLLITHGNLTFDENLPQDFFGADLCMTARMKGMPCFAIDAFCFHNSSRIIGGRTPSYYESEKYFKNKWKDYLPIPTTTTICR